MRLLLSLALLFVTIITSAGKASKSFTQPCAEALAAMYRFDFNTVDALLLSIEKDNPTLQALPYLKQYRHFLAYLANDQQSHYEAFTQAHEKAMAALSNDAEGWHLIFGSNMLLQKSLVEFSRGNNFQGSLSLYKAHKVFREIEPHPGNITWQLKLRAIFNILWDRVPDNMRFFSNLAGCKGDYYMGIRQLVAYHDKLETPGLIDEAKVVLLYVHQLFQQDNEDVVELFDEYQGYSASPLTNFLYSTILIKLNKGQKALELLQTIPQIYHQRFPLLQYQYARLLLNAGFISQAKAEMEVFIKTYKGNTFYNDACLQMSRACFLNADNNEAAEWSLKCFNRQPTYTAIDRQAVDECRQFNLWDASLLRARLLFDHGNYEKAQEWASKPVSSPQAKLEQSYRKGRIAHKRGNLPVALQHYNQAILLANKDARYYGPYAALFCAEIKILSNDHQEASRYLAVARKLNNGHYRQDVERKIKECQKRLK